MGVHTEPARTARTNADLLGVARVVVRGLAVTFVLLIISALPGPVPATARDGDTTGAGNRPPPPAYELNSAELGADVARDTASIAQRRGGGPAPTAGAPR